MRFVDLDGEYHFGINHLTQDWYLRTIDIAHDHFGFCTLMSSQLTPKINRTF
jgi:hypothetical protein